jgi:hypothetical protein
MNDIVERLRGNRDPLRCFGTMEEAADEIERAYKTAVSLLLVLMEKHFPEAKIEPLPDIVGVISQIDNLTTALSRTDQ